MATTEHERLELYELAKHEVGDRFAELMMKTLPPEPDRLATKDDLADLRGDFAELRGDFAELRADVTVEIAGLRGEMHDQIAGLRTEMHDQIGGLRTDIVATRGDLRTEMRDLTVGQTRTMMLGLVGSVTALAITELVINALG